MKRQLVFLLASILMVHVSAAEPELSGTPTELSRHLASVPGQVTIPGVAERTVEADRAVMQVSVVTSDRLLKAALEKNNKTRTDIVAALTAGGIAADRIHTSRFSSTPVHSSWSGKVKEYDIESTVRVSATAEKEIHLIAGLVDTLDEVSLSSLTFEVTKKDEIPLELLGEAFQKIQERRELYEESLGVSLRPRQVGLQPAEEDYRRAQWAAGGEKELLTVSSMMTGPDVRMMLHALGQQEPELSQFEELKFKVEILVTFDVVPLAEEGEASR